MELSLYGILVKFNPWSISNNFKTCSTNIIQFKINKDIFSLMKYGTHPRLSINKLKLQLIIFLQLISKISNIKIIESYVRLNSFKFCWKHFKVHVNTCMTFQKTHREHQQTKAPTWRKCFPFAWLYFLSFDFALARLNRRTKFEGESV